MSFIIKIGGILMANEIVKYDSELNTIPLRKFSPVEMNLFFSIVSRMRDKENAVISFPFHELKELSDYKMTASKAFIKDLENTYDKLMDLNFSKRSVSGLSVEKFRMFTRFKINGDIDTPYVEIQVHEMAIPLLNNLEQWVRYSLTEFRELNSGYSKTMYRLLKQYRTTGYAYFSKSDFNELLDVPKSYKQPDVDKRIINPIRQELTAIFKGLSIKKKYGKGRGKPVVGYQFTFKPEIKNSDDFNKHAPTLEEQNKALEKANKQLNYPNIDSSIADQIAQKQKEIELLTQLNELKQESIQLTEQDKNGLLNGLHHLGKPSTEK